MKKPLVKMGSIMSLSVLASVFAWDNSALTAEAISMTTGSFCEEFVKIPGIDPISVKGVDGKSYKVYYAKKFAGCGATSKTAAHYNKFGLNAFYRRTYAKADEKDTEYLISYQHIPESVYRTRDAYDWESMYEVLTEYQSTWRTAMVDRNTMYCGMREKAKGSYPAIGWTCAAQPGTGNASQGQVYRYTGFDAYGTWRGVASQGANTKGEVRYFGYSEFGQSVLNTYFPNDYPVNYNLNNYHYDDDIFTAGNPFVVPSEWDYAEKGSALYQQKYDAVKRLKEQEGLSGSVEMWMKRLNLMNNPVTEAGSFRASGWGGTRYIAITLNPPAEADRNIGIESMTIYDEDGTTPISTMTRVVGTSAYEVEHHETKKVMAGETYKVQIVLKNSAEVSTVSKNHSVQVQNSLTNGKDEWEVKEADQSGVIPSKGTVTVTFDYEIPEDAKDTLNIEAKINESYKEAGDNTFMDDDRASLQVKVDEAPEGDLAMKNIYLVDAKKSTDDQLYFVDYPIQGVEYFLVYEIEYQGESMKDADFTIEIESTIDSYSPQPDGTISSHKFSDVIDGKRPSKTVKLETATAEEPQTMYIKGGTFTATTSKIDVDASIIVGDFKWTFNKDTDNDQMDKTFYEPVNLAMKKVTVDPATHPGGDYCGPFTVNYSVDFIWNTQEGKDKEVQNVKVAIMVQKPGESTYTTVKTETIRVYANQMNQQYGTKITDVCVPEGSKIKVVVNPNHALHETDTSDNEKAYTWNALSNRVDYCAQSSNKNTENSWTQRYVVLERQEGGYSDIVDILTSADDAIETANKETYEITAIWMNSKLMRDKGYGSAHPDGAGSGWVNALDPASGEEVVIKAGYAFTFQIDVKYSTNAYKNEANHPSLNGLASNQDVYVRLEDLPLNDDLYLKTSDGKTISLTSTDIRFVKSQSGDKNEMIITYELDSRLSPNGTDQQVNGLFIHENTKDGMYTLDFYTAPVYGVPGKTTNDIVASNPSSYRPLCDSDQISFRVNGSYRDDLNVTLIK